MTVLDVGKDIEKLELLHIAPLCGSGGEESSYNAGDLGLIPGLGSSPGEGNGNPLQIPAWRIPWTEEPSRPQSQGLQSQARLSSSQTSTFTFKAGNAS